MKKLLASTIATLMLCLPLSIQAKVGHLLPKVHSLTETKGTPFALHRAVTITDANNTVALEKVFTDYGCTIEDGASATVTVEMVQSIEGAYDYTLEGYDNEGYQLTVTENAIAIKAVKPIGVIRAAQTLAQLAEGYDEGSEAIETVEITDWAAFKLRGYMHDVGRSFISVDELKKHIELLSRFKVNTFHWHFTENQAWRFEVIDSDPAAEPDYTKLTSTESMTRFAGDYYTQAQCREVAQYAKERGVTIIPEIDMPGHSAAFKRAMGYSMQTDEGVAVLKEVLTQLADVFPDAPYIHIGADEEAITYTKDGKGFLEIMASHIRETLKRKMVVWNPISGVTINNTMTDMTQMWSSRGTDIAGVPDIDCRYNYTNHFDVFADVVGIYKSNIYYADKGSEEIAGTISAYWNDRKTPTEEDIVKQNNMYANVLASAERAWIGGRTNGEAGYIEKLGTTLPNSGEVYDEFKDWETRFLFHKTHSLKDEPIPYVKQTNVRWRITDPFPNGGNSGATFAPDQYAMSTDDEGLIPETFIHEGKTYYTGMATGAGIYLRHTWGNNIIPTYYGTTNHSNMTAYAWTYVYSPKAQTVGAQIEFQNYGRSEKDSAPDAGKWDRKGSDIWLNGSRINPPTWDNTGKGINNEVDLLNENFTARSPIEVQLNEGWNKVFIKLPYVGAGGVRLNKWMFTCVFTDLEGKNAVEGLIYSPNQCKDETTELVAAKVSEIKRDRGGLIGTVVGLWPESTAEALNAKIKEVEATYDAAMTTEERAAQVKELEEAWTAFTASLTSDNMNQPLSSTSDKAVYYRMYTPQRESRYPTAKGVGADIVGEKTPTDNSIWKFVKRNDATFDIINAAEKSYISPASNNNTALKTASSSPVAGWTVKPAATKGQVIIVSGSVQFNQTNNSTLGYKVYNWGGGSNTTDTGCQYVFEEVEYTPSDLEGDEENDKFYLAANTKQGDGSYVNRYLYVNNGALANSTTFDKANSSYVWELIANGSDSYYIRNGSGKYLSYANKSLMVADAGYSFQFKNDAVHTGVGAKSLYNPTSSGGKYMVMAANGTGYNQNSSPVNDGSWCSDFILTPAMNSDALPSLAVVSPKWAYATFTWNNRDITSTPYHQEGEEEVTHPTLALKTSNEAYKFEGFFTDASYTTPLPSTTIEALEPGMTVYAKFTLDIFSEKYGDKWIHIVRAAVPGHAITLDNNTKGTSPAFNSLDYSNEGVLWCLVGTAESFKLYNKVGGKDLALKSDATPANSVTVSMVAEGDAQNWHLIGQGENYAIAPVGNTSHGINAFGGTDFLGGPIKFWGAGDGGSHWNFNGVNLSKPFTLEVAVDQVWESSPRVAELSMTLNGVTSSARLTGSVAEKVYYLPTYATTFSLSSMAYRGYTFNGFSEGVTEYKDQEIPEEGVRITASYTANAERTLFYTPRDGHPYRIPAIATAPNGDIFAICDYRPCGNDIGYGEVDLVCRVSSDNGVTWSEERCIADGLGKDYAKNDTSLIWKVGYGDPAIVADRERNEVLVMSVCGNRTCWDGNFGEADPNPNRVSRIRIKYDEVKKEWIYGEPEEVTYDIYPKFVDNKGNVHAASLFIGAGKICQSRVVKKGDYYRLYCAVWNVTKTQRQHHNYVIYSDDFGETWNVLGKLGYDYCPSKWGNEPKCEELPDGTVVLSSRKYSGRYFNFFTFSDKTYTTGSWGTEVASNEVSGGLSFGGNSTNGEIYKVPVIRKSDGAKCDVMFQSIPTGNQRTDVAIYYKEMEYEADGTNKYTPATFSQGWTKGVHVSTKGSCYSTMILQADGRIAFFFEEEPGGYCMVYIPYTIEELTNGAYGIDKEGMGIDSPFVDAYPHGTPEVYDLMGRKHSQVSEKGIYIVNGKKMIHGN